MAKAVKKVATPKLNVKTEAAKKTAAMPTRKETSKTKFVIVAVVGLAAAFGVNHFVKKWHDQPVAPVVATKPAPVTKAEKPAETKTTPVAAFTTLETGKYVAVHKLADGKVEKRTGGTEDWRMRKSERGAGRITMFANEAAWKASKAPAPKPEAKKPVDNGFRFWTE